MTRFTGCALLAVALAAACSKDKGQDPASTDAKKPVGSIKLEPPPGAKASCPASAWKSSSGKHPTFCLVVPDGYSSTENVLSANAHEYTFARKDGGASFGVTVLAMPPNQGLAAFKGEQEPLKLVKEEVLPSGITYLEYEGTGETRRLSHAAKGEKAPPVAGISDEWTIRCRTADYEGNRIPELHGACKSLIYP